jgi:hypothetical protein
VGYTDSNAVTARQSMLVKQDAASKSGGKNTNPNEKYQHLTTSTHKFDKHKNVTLLHQYSKGKVLDKLEEIETVEHKISKEHRLLNDVTFTYINNIIFRIFEYDNNETVNHN